MAESTVGGSTAGVGGAGLFSRQSSGLVRDFSLADIAWYGVFSTGGAFGLVYLFPTPQFVSPGISIPVLILVFLFYAGRLLRVRRMGSAMPRAGGDYLYECRSLHPGDRVRRAVGLPAAVLAGIPRLGRVRGEHSWAGPHRRTRSGWTECRELAARPERHLRGRGDRRASLCCLLTVFGLRVYRTLQRYVLVPRSWPSVCSRSHRARWPTWAPTSTPSSTRSMLGDSITVASVQKAAAKAGFHATSFSLGHTLIWIGVLAGVIPTRCTPPRA